MMKTEDIKAYSPGAIERYVIFSSYLGCKVKVRPSLIEKMNGEKTYGTRYGVLHSVNTYGEAVVLGAYKIPLPGRIMVEHLSVFVKPISKIHDEDALAVAKIEWPDEDGSYIIRREEYGVRVDCGNDGAVTFRDDWAKCTKDFRWDECPLTLESIQLLQLKCYALPYGKLSVDKLVEFGIFKLQP